MGVWAVWVMGGWVMGVFGCWVVGLVVGWLGCLFVLGCENMERHRKAKANDKKEGSGELGTDFGDWLRRRPAKPMGSARVGSNPIGVAVALNAGIFFCPSHDH